MKQICCSPMKMLDNGVSTSDTGGSHAWVRISTIMLPCEPFTLLCLIPFKIQPCEKRTDTHTTAKNIQRP